MRNLIVSFKGGSVESTGSTASHVVSYSLSRSRAYVVEYADTAEMDMFQVGRSTESNIDMVLIDTVPGQSLCHLNSSHCPLDIGNGLLFEGATRLEDCTKSESTISRYACRIMVNRSHAGGRDAKPRIYAAGFDHNRSIQLGVRFFMITLCIAQQVTSCGLGEGLEVADESWVSH